MSTLHRIDHESRLYVLAHGPADKPTGYTCYGFDNADRDGRAYAAWAGAPWPDDVTPGTPEHYAAYVAARDAAANRNRATGERCPSFLTPELDRWHGWRVEVRHPDGTRERFNVGRSTGWAPINLAIHNARSVGGPSAYFPPGSTVTPIRRVR